jgi:hypothetical protein
MFDLTSATAVLRRTPDTLDGLLRDLPREWTVAHEGPSTWSALDIVGHLIHGERTDWIPRAQLILRDGDATPFKPFDRAGHEAASRGKTMSDLLDEFRTLRTANLAILDGLHLSPEDFTRRGMHPELGTTTLSQLIATWVVHDLNHIAQATRVMAKRYDTEVGPWKAYLRILRA